MSKPIRHMQLKEWEVKHSSLFKKGNFDATYEQCRKYACNDISNCTLNHDALNEKSSVLEIPKGNEFHFIGRVNTSIGGNNPTSYYETFRRRDFVAFSTINNKNISHYKGDVFFAYNILPDDIVHIFPLDSDTEKMAKSEKELTSLPSLWLTLDDLENLTEQMKVYNQITCKTKRNGQIIKPYAVIAFDKIDTKILSIANSFKIKCIILHPNKDAINYNNDLLYDCCWLNSISPIMENKYGISVRNLAYLD